MFKAPIRIAGTGFYLPEKILTNDDLAAMPHLVTSDEWITQRTGIKERHLAGDDQATSDFAAPAAEKAMEMAGITAKDLDLIVAATITPDNIFPSLGNWLQKKLGCNDIGSYDVMAACSGFVYALANARTMMTVDGYKNVLVVGAETLSRITDWEDRNMCILFGDGGAAVILQPCEKDASWIGPVFLASQGRPDILITPGGGSRIPASHESIDRRDHYMKMKGRAVFKFVVNRFEEMVKMELERHKLSIDDIKYIVPHQVNQRIMNSVADRMGFAHDKIFSNLAYVGNTSGASVPIALAEMNEKGLLERGDLLMFCVFGGALTWASVVLRW